MPDVKPRLAEIVVVEGLHDAQAVHEAVLADVWVIGGDRVARRFLSELQRVEKGRGLIILTDPDGPGERIRRRLEAAVPSAKHAFVAKDLAIGRGKVGIEHASPDVIRAALLAAKANVVSAVAHFAYTLDDLMDAGLIGSPNAGEKRRQVGDILNIGTGNAKAFLHKLNGLGISRDEWLQALAQVGEKTSQMR